MGRPTRNECSGAFHAPAAPVVGVRLLSVGPERFASHFGGHRRPAPNKYVPKRWLIRPLRRPDVRRRVCMALQSIQQRLRRCNVRFTPKADMCDATCDVRFGSKADMCAAKRHSTRPALRSNRVGGTFIKIRQGRLGQLVWVSQSPARSAMATVWLLIISVGAALSLDQTIVVPGIASEAECRALYEKIVGPKRRPKYVCHSYQTRVTP